jgi:hypothetical protein
MSYETLISIYVEMNGYIYGRFLGAIQMMLLYQLRRRRYQSIDRFYMVPLQNHDQYINIYLKLNLSKEPFLKKVLE